MENNEQKLSRLPVEKYKGLFGVTKKVFDIMHEVLLAEHKRLNKANRRPPKLSVLDKLIITLKYYKEYSTMESIGFEYGVQKNAISDAVSWVESVLIKDKRFHLPGKKELRESEFEVILVDCTEHPIQRPKKNSTNGTQARKNDTPSKQ